MDRNCISPSGNYSIEYEEHPEAVIVKVINKLRDDDDQVIYTYKQRKTYRPFSDFIIINGDEWWVSGRDYMLQLFVNCVTGEVYDDPNKIENTDEYKKGSCFIWKAWPIVSPDGKYLFVDGCYWACPYEWKLYDISNLGGGGGYKEIDLLDDITILDGAEGIEDEIIVDSDLFSFKFASNKKVEIYKKDYVGYFEL